MYTIDDVSKGTIVAITVSAENDIGTKTIKMSCKLYVHVLWLIFFYCYS